MLARLCWLPVFAVLLAGDATVGDWNYDFDLHGLPLPIARVDRDGIPEDAFPGNLLVDVCVWAALAAAVRRLVGKTDQ